MVHYILLSTQTEPQVGISCQEVEELVEDEQKESLSDAESNTTDLHDMVNIIIHNLIILLHVKKPI